MFLYTYLLTLIAVKGHKPADSIQRRFDVVDSC